MSATFLFDVGSPYAYLAAERVNTLLPGQVRWQPVLLGGLFRLARRSSWATGDRWRRELGMSEVERRAAAYGLGAVTWPEPWPGDGLAVMRAVSFAFSISHGEEFALEAFRAAFRRGRDLSVRANILEVAWAAGLNPSEVDEAIEDPAVKAELRAATDAAFAAGVTGVPSVVSRGRVFWGDDQLEAAAAFIAAPH